MAKRPLLQQEPHEYFSFPDLLEEGHILVYNPSLGVLSRLYPGENYPQIYGEQQFTSSESTLLLPLLRSYPDYASYELLLTSYCYGVDGITDERLEKARKHLIKLMDEGEWDTEFRVMRNIVGRTRAKLRGLELDVVSLLETGYMLHKLRERKQHHEKDMSLTAKL